MPVDKIGLLPHLHERARPRNGAGQSGQTAVARRARPAGNQKAWAAGIAPTSAVQIVKEIAVTSGKPLALSYLDDAWS
jgi:hypothetical protein